MATLGFIGLGVMGSRMVKRLVRTWLINVCEFGQAHTIPSSSAIHCSCRNPPNAANGAKEIQVFSAAGDHPGNARHSIGSATPFKPNMPPMTRSAASRLVARKNTQAITTQTNVMNAESSRPTAVVRERS